MKKLKFILSIFLSLILTSCGNEKEDGMFAKVTTNKGDVLITLEFDKVPLTVANFIGLSLGELNKASKKGPFYDGLIFHRVVDNVMIQGGCPDGNGQGNPGYTISDEFNNDLKHDSHGIVSMNNQGIPNNNGSQFFITYKEFPQLDGRCSVFGSIKDSISLSILNSIEQGDSIESIEIIRRGSDAKNFNALEVFNSKQEEIAKEEEIRMNKLNNVLDSISSGSTITDSGLRYSIIEEGSGDSPVSGDNVSVHYSGFLLDGTKFDSSFDRGEPITFPLAQGRVIKGWDEGISLLKVGGKAKFIIPPDLAYGNRSMGTIPANSILIFDVELIEIVK